MNDETASRSDSALRERVKRGAASGTGRKVSARSSSLRTSTPPILEVRVGALTSPVLAELRQSGDAQSAALRRLEVEAMLRWASTVRQVGHGWQWGAELDDSGDSGRLGRLIEELFGHSPSSRLLDVPCRGPRWLLEGQGRAGGDLAVRAGLVHRGRPVHGVAPRVVAAGGHRDRGSSSCRVHERSASSVWSI